MSAQHSVRFLPSCASEAAARLPSHPFLALRVHFADLGTSGGPFFTPTKTALFVVSPDKPTGRYTGNYFALAPASFTDSDARTLNIQPPLHTRHSLYLHTLPVITESLFNSEVKSAAAAKVALPNKLDDHDLRVFCRASLEESVADLASWRLRSGNMDNVEVGWDTLSGGPPGGIRRDPGNICYRFLSFEDASLSVTPSIFGELRLLEK